MRCFVALELSEEIRKKIYSLAGELMGKGKLVELENLHTTILFLGEVSDSRILEIKKKIEENNIQIGKYEVEYKGIGAFPNIRSPRVVWVGSNASQLYSINKQLSDSPNIHEERFHPHVTILRTREGSGKIPLDFFEKYEKMEFGREIAPKIVLKKSTLTPNGPIYSNL